MPNLCGHRTAYSKNGQNWPYMNISFRDFAKITVAQIQNAEAFIFFNIFS